VIPWLILGLVAAAVLVFGVTATRRRTVAGESPAQRAQTEQEFAEAEAYEEQWRDADKQRFRDERLP
jgi:hypothetical protein